jgi:acyl-CoA synthetase (AMP-forming)/AMP-acid ligase II
METPMWRYADIRTVPDTIRYWSAVAPQRVALVQGPRQVTYRELDDRSSQIAAALLAAGAGPGSHIGFLGRNSAEFFETWLGIVELFDDAQPPVVFASEELRKRSRR